MSEQPPPPTAEQLLTRGALIGDRYRLEATIATGGMATVWRAVDTVLTRPVAVKVLHANLAADPEFVARFRREAVAAARLTHPHIVATYDTCDDPEAIVMELVEGRTLRDELDARGFVPPPEAVAIASAVCQALEAAHRAGIVHRDIKPANILLAADGRLKVADFGIAKAATATDVDDPDLPDVTTIGKMVGTAKYLAPEQVSGGAIDARTDVYSLGVVLYELLCGRAPFEGDNDLATATARLHRPPERPVSVLRTIPQRLDAIVMRALAVDPAQRYPSAAALWADLQSCPIEDAATPALTVDATRIEDQPSFTMAERSWLVPAGLITLVGVALVLAWLLIGGTEARRDLLDLVDRVAPGIGAADAPAPEPITVTATAFDPRGDGSEHDELTAMVVDGDPDTVWRTERYQSRAFGGLKDGVGLVLDLGESRVLRDLEIDSPDDGWSVTVYVARRPGATLAAWGDPVATIEGVDAGTTRVDLDGATGTSVLVWVTDLGTDPGVVLELGEISLRAEM